MGTDGHLIIPNLLRRSSRIFEIPEEEAKERMGKLGEEYSRIEPWLPRAREIRESILEAAALWPLPEKRLLNPIIRNKKKALGYEVANVAFETFPGFYCTGNLYRPQDSDNRMPGILCPHGHFAKEGGRFSQMVQARCARLAQMGATVFAYDMVGWGESLQVAHDNPDVFSFQLWNTLRSVDFLLSLDNIDSTRIGITGCSGGGTQSFMAAAVDDRIGLSIPVAMVSAHYYGGCVCETGLPIHDSCQVNNAEIAAVAAPRPQLLISVGTDFTRNTPQVEYPFIKKVYGAYNAEDKIENVHLVDEKHDYGPNKRKAMYSFVARHFGLRTIKDPLSGDEQVPENVRVLAREDLCVFTKKDLKSTIKPLAPIQFKELIR